MRAILMGVTAILVLVACLSGCVDSRSSIADAVEKVMREDGIDAAIAKYRELKETSPEKYDFNISELRELGLKLFKNGETPQAIRIAELNAEIFPDSALVFYDLARVFRHSGNSERSRQNILESLELDSLSLASVILGKKIFFVPDTFDVPLRLETDAFLVRPLRAADVDLDYAAVMSSLEHLRGVFGPGSRWPSSELTREQDLKALEIHEEEFSSREAFTYTVMNPEETECLGCIYINYSKLDTCDAQVVLWVTATAHESGLDPAVYEAVREWVESSWPFGRVVFPGREVAWRTFNDQLGEQDTKYH